MLGKSRGIQDMEYMGFCGDSMMGRGRKEEENVRKRLSSVLRA